MAGDPRVDLRYRFYRLFAIDLEAARQSLAMLSRYAEADVRFCILRDAIIAYCRPFSGNEDGSGGSYSLPIKLIPKEQRPLHRELVKMRNEMFVHTDYAYRRPRIASWETPTGFIYPMAFRAPDYGLLLGRVDEIEALVRLAETELRVRIRAIEAEHERLYQSSITR